MAGLLGVAAAVATGLLANWELAALAGWDMFVITLVATIWHDFAGHTPGQTAAIARRDDMNHSLIDTIVLTTSLASIAAVVVLISGKDVAIARILFGLGSVVASWVAVHTLYTLRYAVLYYRGKEEGGVDFNSPEKPTFRDFAYLAFTIGMTYQVSDTNLTSSDMRRAALSHSLISFVFGVAIIATTINFLASLAQ